MINPRMPLPVESALRDRRDAIERGDLRGRYLPTGPGEVYYTSGKGEIRLTRPKLRGKAARKAAKRRRHV